MRELHIRMAAYGTAGAYIQESGLDDALLKSEIWTCHHQAKHGVQALQKQNKTKQNKTKKNWSSSLQALASPSCF